jgi:hypothetical protein
MSAAASATRSLHAKRLQFDFLDNVLEAMNSNSRDKIEDLTARLAGKLESEAAPNPFLSLRNYIFHDIV